MITAFLSGNAFYASVSNGWQSNCLYEIKHYVNCRTTRFPIHLILLKASYFLSTLDHYIFSHELFYFLYKLQIKQRLSSFGMLNVANKTEKIYAHHIINQYNIILHIKLFEIIFLRYLCLYNSCLQQI